jgi:type IV secretory pathway VirB10-like protein
MRAKQSGTKSWLIGQYDSSVAFGQSRILLVWSRIIMPGGTSIVLERQPGADTQGYAGLEDEVDNHWGMLFKAAGDSNPRRVRGRTTNDRESTTD